MKISIIIPAYQEEQRLGRTLEQYGAYFSNLKKEQKLDFEIVVVANNCRDNTVGVAQAISARYTEIRVIDIKPGGKGLAIAVGFRDALTRPNDSIGFVDADMATQPEQFYALIAQMGSYDGAIASRYSKGATVIPARPWIKYWGRKLVYDNLVYCLFGLPYYDYQCGAKVFSRRTIEQVALQLSIAQWAFDVELLYLCKRAGCRIKEIPTVWYDQDGSKLNVMDAGMRMLRSVISLRMRYSPFKKWVTTTQQEICEK